MGGMKYSRPRAQMARDTASVPTMVPASLHGATSVTYLTCEHPAICLGVRCNRLVSCYLYVNLIWVSLSIRLLCTGTIVR